MIDKTLKGAIVEVIREEVKYLRHYLGEVGDVDDPDKEGKVKCKIPELERKTNDVGLWCYPRDKAAIVTPKVGDFVEVYFMLGDRDRPVYMGMAQEITGNRPKAHTGPTKQVLFQSRETDKEISYDDPSGLLTLLKATEPFVLGNQLQTFLSAFVTAYNSHIHQVAVAPGPTTGPAPTQGSPMGLLSTTIKGE